MILENALIEISKRINLLPGYRSIVRSGNNDSYIKVYEYIDKDNWLDVARVNSDLTVSGYNSGLMIDIINIISNFKLNPQQ